MSEYFQRYSLPSASHNNTMPSQGKKPILISYLLRIFQLVTHKQTDSLYRLLRPINIVPQEKIISVRRKASGFEQSQKIEKLAMSVSAYMNWSLDLKEHGL